MSDATLTNAEASAQEADWPGPAWIAALSVIALFGAWLRVRGLGSQVALGDEVHAIWAVLELSYGEISGQFLRSHISIPTTLVSKVLAETVGLDEITLRIIPLLSGIATVPILSLMVVRRIGRVPALVFAALLATSPMLVFFSRNGRPYAVGVLMVAVAVLVLVRFMEVPSTRLRVAYVLCGVFAGWIHLLTLPALLVPLVIGAARCFVLRGADRERAAGGPRLRDYAILAGLLFGGLGILLAAPLIASDAKQLEKAFSTPVSAATLGYALQALAGAPSAWATGIAALGLLVGVWIGYGRDRLLTVVLLATMGGQLAAMLFLHPKGVSMSWILARYNVWLVPLLLLPWSWSVCALERLPGRAGRFAPATMPHS